MDEPRDLFAVPWYLVGPPWGGADFIRAGAEDAGSYVCGIEPAVWDADEQLQEPCAVLAHIVQLHNDSLHAPARQLTLADARAARAEQVLGSLCDAVRRYRAAVRACNGIVDAEAALFQVLDALENNHAG